MQNKARELYALDNLACGNTCIHRLHPTIKLITTIIFIITVASFDRYSFDRLIPFVFFPTILMALSETPYTMLLKRFIIALPFCLFAGIANIFFDTAPAFEISGFVINYGIVSFFTIMYKAYLCVMAVMVLVSVTALSEITNSMRSLKIPGIFVIVFEMTYRYIGILFDEAYTMYLAYSLRSANKKGIDIKDMGSFIGQLLLRSFDRAEYVYNAMKCRGYALYNMPRAGKRLTAMNWFFLFSVSTFCITLRVFNLSRVFIVKQL